MTASHVSDFRFRMKLSKNGHRWKNTKKHHFNICFELCKLHSAHEPKLRTPLIPPFSKRRPPLSWVFAEGRGGEPK